MRTVIVLAAAVFMGGAPDRGVNLEVIDLYVDTGDDGIALGAWQIEIVATGGTVKLVGLEGGDHPAFREPPHYDPNAMSGRRIVAAGYSTDLLLPVGKTRVAGIHVLVEGDVSFNVRLIAAADAAAQRIDASVSHMRGKK